MEYFAPQPKQDFEYGYSQLSRREQQVTEKIVQGLPNKTIANELFICERTVKFHCNNIYRKLNIANRNKLTARYFQHQYSLMQRGNPDLSISHGSKINLHGIETSTF